MVMSGPFTSIIDRDIGGKVQPLHPFFSVGRYRWTVDDAMQSRTNRKRTVSKIYRANTLTHLEPRLHNPAALHLSHSLQALEKKIREGLRQHKHVALYEADLQRIWSPNDPNREQKIKRFAEDHGWRVTVVNLGLCAMFEQS